MRHVVLVIALMSAVSCGGEGGGSPGSPSPTPPTPAAQTWTLSGTVTETAPTASTLIAGATVTAVAGLDTDGPSVTSDANGVFHLASLAPGDYTIRTRAVNYAESSQPLTLADNQTMTVQLDPVFQMVTATTRDVITGDPSCPGYWDYSKSDVPRTAASEPCQVDFLFDVHHEGTLHAELAWADRRFGLSTELYRSDRGLPSGRAIEPRAGGSRLVSYDVDAHAQYVVRVGFDGGGSPPAGTTEFTLTVTRPN
jgi:Carboxypeptidase regulatory-like domain